MNSGAATGVLPDPLHRNGTAFLLPSCLPHSNSFFNHVLQIADFAGELAGLERCSGSECGDVVEEAAAVHGRRKWEVNNPRQAVSREVQGDS